jgi:hypothetical protein
MVQFEAFTQKRLRRRKQPMLTVSGERIGFNAALMDAMGSPEAVLLYFDRTTAQIGIKPAKRKNPLAYAVRRKGNAGAMLSVGLFVEAYDITKIVGSSIAHFVVTYDEPNHLFVANLTRSIEQFA